MGEKEKLFVVDDDEMHHFMLGLVLKEGPHQIVRSARTMKEALGMIPNITTAGVTVALIDGNLTLGDNTGRDGEAITNAIKAVAPRIQVLLFSSSSYNYGDGFISKQDFRQNLPAGDINQVLNNIKH